MAKHTILEKTLRASGLTQGEFSQIAGMSRVMVNRYINRGSEPVGNNKRRVEAAVTLLHALVEGKKLPLPEGADRERRKSAVAKIKAHLDAGL